MFIVKVLAALIVLFFISFIFLGMKSQKGEAPGIVGGTLAACPSSPNCVSSEANAPEKKKVAPLNASMSDIVAIIKSMGGTITSESDDYVSATFMSKMFKFVDDVELRRGDDGNVQIRSCSRVGYSDRDVNRKRVEAIRAALKS